MTNEIRKIQNNNIKVNDNNENVKNNSSYNHNVTDNDNHVSIDHNSHNNTSNTDNNTRNNTNNNDDNISDNNTNNNDRRIINDHDNDNINNNENNGNHVTIAQVIVDNLINNDNHVISNNLVSNVNNSNNDVVADHVGDNDANSITNSNNNNSDNNDDHVDHVNDNNTINDNLVIANSIHNNNNNSNNNTDSAKLTLFYRNLMSSSYKEDKYIIRKIIKKGVHPVDSNEKINLLIYYKNFKSQQLLIKNSPNVKLATTQHSHVIYQFLCPHEDCTQANDVTASIKPLAEAFIVSGCSGKYIPARISGEITVTETLAIELRPTTLAEQTFFVSLSRSGALSEWKCADRLPSEKMSWADYDFREDHFVS
ncbi:hypothetical protein HELRODRAFT_165294 [Helobdella robusta]|uniref:Uncharacterized protein n=1 Tax=Helobdella robusta TaxID=6412 RepID=T1EWJ7_HELRO|nr:hypothetical protein HELRODRAFT_165294 [Helobdella robusta]ESN91290.1 hypothetical protein HELRODRAFT_165294 [Helobdella robusta]